MSQVIGTFSAPGGYFQITANGVSFVDDVPEGTVTEIGFLSENSKEKIPQELIRECIDKHSKTGIPHLILDISDKAKISDKLGLKSESREIKIDTILSTKFEVVSWYELLDFPSRQSFYDSVTQCNGLFERHYKVLQFLNSLDFNIVDLLESGVSQQEILYDTYHREISYRSLSSPAITIRVKPNLMIEVIVLPNDNSEANKRYFFFYNPTQIINIVSENSPIDVKRDIKINSLII